jgi:hypothetical protein
MKVKLHHEGNCTPFATGIIPYDDIEEMESTTAEHLSIRDVYSLQQMLFQEYML